MLGGLVAQEALKGLTSKFMPMRQWLYMDVSELVAQGTKSVAAAAAAAAGSELLPRTETRYAHLDLCVGRSLAERIQRQRVFVVGAGAVGCELLKNYGMLGVGTQGEGQVTVTDPDVIENSNLNRQFLFREQHLRKPKAHVAACAIVEMNPGLERRVEVHLLRVHEASEDVFSDEFLSKHVDVVSNALDNVKARLYVDARCLANRRPLLEPGTLGPKGHLQVVLPGLTETYASQADPEEEGQDIPYCTLRMFPEEPTHCIEWARDRFSKLFTKQPQLLAQVLERRDRVSTALDIQVLKGVDRLLRKRPRSFDDCVAFAARKFWKYFRSDALQLLHVYPRDLVGKDGKPFWSLPKRPPVPIDLFDPEDTTHVAFIVSAASLRAHEFDIPAPEWTAAARAEVAARVAALPIPAFVPSDAKAKAISSQVQKQEKAEAKEGEEAEAEAEVEVEDEIVAKANGVVAEVKPEALRESIVGAINGADAPGRVVPEEFEKDDDRNFHVDFVCSMTNLRARVYGLAALEWIQVKLKAGRIIPALVTTTAVVAGLAGVELAKVVAGCTLEEQRNTFLNMAVPYMAQSEPGPPKRWAVAPGTKVSVWDRWEVQGPRSIALADVMACVEQRHNVRIANVFCEQRPLFIRDGPVDESKTQLSLRDLLGVEDATEHVDLTVAVVHEGETVAAPLVRVLFE